MEDSHLPLVARSNRQRIYYEPLVTKSKSEHLLTDCIVVAVVVVVAAVASYYSASREHMSY